MSFFFYPCVYSWGSSVREKNRKTEGKPVFSCFGETVPSCYPNQQKRQKKATKTKKILYAHIFTGKQATLLFGSHAVINPPSAAEGACRRAQLSDSARSHIIGGSNICSSKFLASLSSLKVCAREAAIFSI